MPGPYDFDSFLESIADLSIDQMRDHADRASKSAENDSYGKKGAVRARNLGSPEFISLIGKLRFFLWHKSRPDGIIDNIFLKFKPLAEKLVKKKDLDAKILKIFPTTS